MTQRAPIGRRPSAETTVDQWVRRGDKPLRTTAQTGAETYSARLTLDVTPTLRGQIKIVAFKNGVTVAELLRRLLEREFGGNSETI